MDNLTVTLTSGPGKTYCSLCSTALHEKTNKLQVQGLSDESSHALSGLQGLKSGLSRHHGVKRQKVKSPGRPRHSRIPVEAQGFDGNSGNWMCMVGKFSSSSLQEDPQQGQMATSPGGGESKIWGTAEQQDEGHAAAQSMDEVGWGHLWCAYSHWQCHGRTTLRSKQKWSKYQKLVEQCQGRDVVTPSGV